MDVNGFDKKVREMMDSFEDSIDVDLWSGIEKRLDRRKRVVVWRRVSYVAAAACLALGLILSIPKKNDFVRVADIQDGFIKVAPPQIDILPITPLKALNNVSRNRVVKNTIPENEVQAQYTAQVVVEETVEDREPQTRSNNSKSGVEEKPIEVASISDNYLAQLYDEEPQKKRRPLTIGIASNILTSNSGSIDLSQPQFAPGAHKDSYGIVPISEPRFALPLTSGVQAQMQIVDRLSAGIGLNYTVLMNNYEGLIDNSDQGVVEETLRYIGIPLSIYYDIISNDWLRFYLSGGAVYEKGIQSKSHILGFREDIIYRKSRIKGSQFSINLGVGAEYTFSKYVGLYLDPSLSYFFDCKQPMSIRTVQPLQFKLELGFRFHL